MSARTEHPQPLLRRSWVSLDGEWELAVDPPSGPSRPGDVAYRQGITVPFSPGTPASGVRDVDPAAATFWYRTVASLPTRTGARTLLHFGAADREATVWVNGGLAGTHRGGFTPFAFDVTELLGPDGAAEIVVRCDDPPGDLDVPRGKQDWRDEPHAIWYPRTSGLWRTVWAEAVGDPYVSRVDWSCDVAAMVVDAQVGVRGTVPPGARVRVVLRHGDRVIGDVSALISAPTVALRLPLGDGGIDDRWDLLWWPGRPVLLDASVTVTDIDGVVLDEAESYTALREVGVHDGRFLVNGRPYFMRLVLDQGYWPESGLTAPSVDALRHDLELIRRLGFNGARKHQKTEDPRWFASADELGLLAWVEMPSAYRAGAASFRHVLEEWADVVAAHRNYPSVVAWVPINESWGVGGVAGDPRQRAALEALDAVTRSLDGTRPVSANDGWETVGGDIVGIHDYSQDTAVLATRYAVASAVDRMVSGVGPAGRVVDLDGQPAGRRAVVLSEFGGIALAGAGDGTWGYTTAASADDLLERYRAQWAAVHQSTVLAGACWTQLTDTYQEANGLLRADRSPKADLDALAAATRGRPAEPPR